LLGGRSSVIPNVDVREELFNEYPDPYPHSLSFQRVIISESGLKEIVCKIERNLEEILKNILRNCLKNGMGVFDLFF